MVRLLSCAVVGCVFSLLPVFDVVGSVQAEPPELLGIGEFAGTASDLSGLTDALSNGEPHNRLGGFSALEYTGAGNRYLALSDRGPDDGATGYLCRFHTVEIVLTPGARPSVKMQLIDTQLLTDEAGRYLPGASDQFSASATLGARLDPEGLRIGSNGGLWLSDEYGPQLFDLSLHGQVVRKIGLPQHLLIAHPAATKRDENQRNRIGRASNKGMEGLAISPDGSTLFGLMQHVLLQDGERDGDAAPEGRNCRLVQIDIATGEVAEYVYQLDNADLGLNEILAVSNTEFLVIERDGEPHESAKFKKIMLIRLDGATDVAHLDALPHGSLPETIQPVQKQVYIDLLDPNYGLAGNIPEKIEGLTFGPSLADGRRTLLVASDNDFEADNASQIYVFAVEP